LPFKLLLLGDGVRSEFLQQKSTELGIHDQVIWVGFHADAKKYISVFDVGVLFSYAVEAFLMAILEMLSMGKPVVVADISGTSEMVFDGKNGYLIAPRNVESLADKLELLLLDKGLRRRFSTEARQTILEMYTKNAMVEKNKQVLAQLL